MFIKNNQIASQLYVPYTKNIRNLAQSARRLATGEKIPTAADGGGEMGVADRWQQVTRGTNKLIDGMENTVGFLSTQDEVLRQSNEIVLRMSELASSALDVSKNTADRRALEAEFRALDLEFQQIADRQYNGISLFGQSMDVRTGLAAGDTLKLSALTLGNITFAEMGISTLGSASAALISLTSRLGSLNLFKARSGNNSNEIGRVLDFTRQNVRNLSQAENYVRNIDLAVETGNFTKQQVVLAASQSVLSQSNGIVQSALQFLG